MIVYLSGKMTGLEDMGRKFFNNKFEEYTNNGHVVVNPAILPLGLRSESYMPICLSMVDACDMVVMIGDDWNESIGAMLEKDYAIYNNKLVYDDFSKSWIYNPNQITL